MARIAATVLVRVGVIAALVAFVAADVGAPRSAAPQDIATRPPPADCLEVEPLPPAFLEQIAATPPASTGCPTRDTQGGGGRHKSVRTGIPGNTSRWRLRS